MDAEIYEKFRKEFPDMEIKKIVENDLKTPEAKEVRH